MNNKKDKDYEIKNSKLNITTTFKDDDNNDSTNVLKSESILYNKSKKENTFKDKEMKKEEKRK